MRTTRGSSRLSRSRLLRRAHLLRRRPRLHARRTESTPRVQPSGAASHLDPSRQPAGRAIWCGRALLVALLLAAAPGAASGQVFIATQPKPEFTVGPLFVRANVGPKPEAVEVSLL